MARRLGDTLERGNLVLGTAAPSLGRFSASGMGGGGAGVLKREVVSRAVRGSEPSIDRPRDRDPRYPDAPQQ